MQENLNEPPHSKGKILPLSLENSTSNLIQITLHSRTSEPAVVTLPNNPLNEHLRLFLSIEKNMKPSVVTFVTKIKKHC